MIIDKQITITMCYKDHTTQTKYHQKRRCAKRFARDAAGISLFGPFYFIMMKSHHCCFRHSKKQENESSEKLKDQSPDISTPSPSPSPPPEYSRY